MALQQLADPRVRQRGSTSSCSVVSTFTTGSCALPSRTGRRKPASQELPILPELQEVLDASPLGELTFLVMEHGRPSRGGGSRTQCLTLLVQQAMVGSHRALAAHARVDA